MIARFGEPPRAGRRYGLRPGVYAVLPRDGRVLLTHQDSPAPEFQLPGGGIDPGEHPLAALHREVFEETGWTIAPRRRIATYRRFTYMPEYDRWAEKLCHIWLARPVLRRGPPRETGHTACWMTPEAAISSLASRPDAAILTRELGFLLAGRGDFWHSRPQKT